MSNAQRGDQNIGHPLKICGAVGKENARLGNTEILHGYTFCPYAKLTKKSTADL